MLIVNKIFRVNILFFCLFTFTIICARTEENVQTVNDLALSQDDKPQTYTGLSVRSQETGYSSVVCIPDYL